MSGVFNENTTDIGGGRNAGNISTGDWLEYKDTPVTVPKTAVYQITYRVAAMSVAGKLELYDTATGQVIDTVAVPITGGWQKWVSVVQPVSLFAGTYKVGIRAVIGGLNLNWVEVRAGGTDVAAGSSTQASAAASSLVASSASSSVARSSSVPMQSSVVAKSSIAVASSASASPPPQYAGSTKYPYVTMTSGNYKLVVGGEVQPSYYTQLHTAQAAALNVAIMCNCPVTIQTPPITLKVEWKDNPLPTANKCGTAMVNMEWATPTHRENCQPLAVTEIGGYEMGKQVDGGKWAVTKLPPTSLQYTDADLKVGSKYVYRLAVFDTNGLYSQFIYTTVGTVVNLGE